MTPGTTLRVARPTDPLAEVVRFYEDGLGLLRLASFEDHDGFDGVMLGMPGLRIVWSSRRSWSQAGRTFEDPDGYRVVLQHALWPE